jgi:hypothetical protein
MEISPESRVMMRTILMYAGIVVIFFTGMTTTASPAYCEDPISRVMVLRNELIKLKSAVAKNIFGDLNIYSRKSRSTRTVSECTKIIKYLDVMIPYYTKYTEQVKRLNDQCPGTREGIYDFPNQQVTNFPRYLNYYDDKGFLLEAEMDRDSCKSTIEDAGRHENN